MGYAALPESWNAAALRLVGYYSPPSPYVPSLTARGVVARSVGTVRFAGFPSNALRQILLVSQRTCTSSNRSSNITGRGYAHW